MKISHYSVLPVRYLDKTISMKSIFSIWENNLEYVSRLSFVSVSLD